MTAPRDPIPEQPRDQIGRLVSNYANARIDSLKSGDGMAVNLAFQPVLDAVDAIVSRADAADRAYDRASADCSALRAALESVQHNRLCSCYGHMGHPCERCVVGYDEVDAALSSPMSRAATSPAE